MSSAQIQALSNEAKNKVPQGKLSTVQWIEKYNEEFAKLVIDNHSAWISVKDKLPEKDQFVIYHAPGIFETGPQMWIGQYEDNVFFSKHGFFGGGEETHWMPLPNLPESKT